MWPDIPFSSRCFIRRGNVWRSSGSLYINKSDRLEERLRRGPRVTATNGAWIANRLRLPSSALGRLTVFCRGAREYCRNAREPTSNDTAPIPTGFKVVETHGGVTGTWWTAAPYLAAMHPATPTRDTSTGYISPPGVRYIQSYRRLDERNLNFSPLISRPSGSIRTILLLVILPNSVPSVGVNKRKNPIVWQSSSSSQKLEMLKMCSVAFFNFTNVLILKISLELFKKIFIFYINYLYKNNYNSSIKSQWSSL